MVFSTSIFDKQLADLIKKPRNGYSNCLNDTIEILCPLSFIEICNLDDVITKTNELILRKIRIPNTEKGWSKTQGYRLVSLCDLRDENVYLLYVYPKKGKLESSDLTNKGAEILLTDFQKIKSAGEVFKPICPVEAID